ncbi:MAG TPA: alpha/beta hydrolase [Myxococcota bacterium]
MTIEPVRFGAVDQELLGIMHAPEDPSAAHGRPAFVLCKPFGTEAIRADLLYRALATRLVREGCTVLGFDYHGSGDSPGDSAVTSLTTFVHDTESALAFLRARAPASPLHVFGLALGASIAARASLQASARPAQLVLWEAVDNGNAYADKMCATHRADREQWCKVPWATLKAELNEPEPALPGVVLGFPVSATFAAELRALTSLPLDALRAAGVVVTSGHSERPFAWMSNHEPAAGAGEPVPQDAVRAVLATVR